MKLQNLRRTMVLLTIFVSSLSATGCGNDFYLSEREVAAYRSVLATQSSANLNFDNLQGRIVDIQFDNSTGTPRLQSTNLLTEMRRTEMAQLETGPTAVSLDRLRAELETQIGNWIDGRLQLYTHGSDSARLTRLDNVGVRFLNNPTFTYRPERQVIEFDLRMTITINGTIEVNAVHWLWDLFANINGTYPLTIVINNLRLQGEAGILSPFGNASRIRFQLIPQTLGTVDVLENGASVPGEVRDGVRQLLSHNLASRVDEIFAQDYDYFELTNLGLALALGAASSKLEVAYRPKANLLGPESTNPTLHLVSRATDGKLYHARKSSGGWSSYAAIPLPSPSSTPYPRIDNDPTLVHSGSGQMELAATDAGGNLIYSHWRDEAWGNWQITRPNVAATPAVSHRGKPAVVASMPGQVELIVSMSNGYLYHYRRLNGAWVAPVALPILPNLVALPLRDPVAVQIGNKVVVVYVDAQNRLFGQVFDMETGIWGSFMKITTQETIRYAPAAATWSDEATDQVAVVYVGQSGTPYYCKLDVTSTNFTPVVPQSGFSHTPEIVIGGVLNAAPVLVASGHRQLELIARWNDNRLWHKHFVHGLRPFTVDGRTIDPGWQSWSILSENVFGTATTTDGRMSEFAAAATPTGRVELVARGYDNYAYSTQHIFHNNYESNRYGSAPWKTVNWRGYEVASSQMALGRPALVAVDRNFQIGYVGNPALTPSLQYARLSASNATSFTVGPRARAGQNGLTPVVLPSNPGLTDYIYLGDDGRLHHDRGYSNGSGFLYTLTVPTGLSLAWPVAAASYGNGFIELAALASDRRIYHWRYRDGSWSNPTAVASNIISAPVLMYVGAGQLELLAVDVDYKLFRWRHTGGSWANGVNVPSDFRINEGLFGPTAASSWGDGTVDVAVVHRESRALYHRRIGPGDEACTGSGCPAPRVFNKIGGSVIDKPILTAFSPTRLNVLTMTSLPEWFSNWATAHPVQPVTNPPQRDPVLIWSDPQSLGGREMVLGAAAHTGRTNYAVVATHVDGRVFINRNQQGRWTGFRHVSGQWPDKTVLSPVLRPALAAHGG